jgi:Flp pilus assembly protein TadG
MNRHHAISAPRRRRDDSGQIFALVAFILVFLLAFIGFVIDMGRLYYSYRLLQSSTDAAALAGAYALPASTTAATATLYSGVSGNKNAYTNLPNVTMVTNYPMLRCLTTLTNQGLPCVSPANANAITVQQQVSVPMTFAALIGVKAITLTATATAAMRGSARAPYNVAIVVDSTRSMQDSDGGSNCSGSRETCVLQGVQTLLGELSPCAASQASCTISNGQATNPVDEVSLFSFPAVSAATVADQYCGSSGSVSVQPYPLPAIGATPASDPTYQVLGFLSDYRTSDTSSSLSTSSNLVKAAGTTGTSCSGLQDPGGSGTYYAAIIYAAENLLVAQQTARPGTQNAMIILSDGDANATQTQMASTATKSGTYPSYVNECHQAITAAQWAAKQGTGGTTVFTVAYGAESSGCSTDSPAITPCQTMEQMASSSGTFYTDYTSQTLSCVSASQPTTNLNQIFTEIAGYLTVARLIPNNTT